MERKLEVHKNMTLGEVTERAYKVSDFYCNTFCIAMFCISLHNFRCECTGPGAGEVWGATGAVSVGEV